MVRPELVSAIYSTLSGDAVGSVVQASYRLPAIAECRLLHRGRNDVYGLRHANGMHVVRVSRNRAANVAYELPLLAHLKGAGLSVATALTNKQGHASVEIAAVEGVRTLVVFDYLQGEAPGDDLLDFALMGTGLARIHDLAQGYRGPQSAHTLDVNHLVSDPLRRVLSLPAVDGSLGEALSAFASDLVGTIAAMKDLSRVTCHGDFCFPNTLVRTTPGGERCASFFDFEDGGDGCLAYDLAVFLWSELVQSDALTLPDTSRQRWKLFLDGYRKIRAVPDSDFAAVAAFVSARHFWFMGDLASRIDELGTGVMPSRWLRSQLDMLGAWRASLAI